MEMFLFFLSGGSAWLSFVDEFFQLNIFKGGFYSMVSKSAVGLDSGSGSAHCVIGVSSKHYYLLILSDFRQYLIFLLLLERAFMR